MTECTNPDCPNAGKIDTMAFKNTGFCSVSCKKAVGLDVSSVGTIMFVTNDEAVEIRKARSMKNGWLRAFPRSKAQSKLTKAR